MILAVAIQVLCVLFAFFSGRHDVPAINNFRRFGSTDKEQRMFHSANTFMKGIVAAMAAAILIINAFHWKATGLCVLACLFWMWLIFDTTINLLRAGNFKWHYLGGRNVIDIFLWKHGGKIAGKIKAIACVVIAVGLNFLINSIN